MFWGFGKADRAPVHTLTGMPLGLACNAVRWPWSVAAALALGMAHDAEVADVVKLGVIYAERDVGALVITPAQELGVNT